jgi:hypothetical protein
MTLTPLSSADIRRMLQHDRRLNHEMRSVIAQSLAIDAAIGLIPRQLRLAVAARRWPVTLA